MAGFRPGFGMMAATALTATLIVSADAPAVGPGLELKAAGNRPSLSLSQDPTMCDALPGIAKQPGRDDLAEVDLLALHGADDEIVATAVVTSAPRTEDPSQGTEVAISIQGNQYGPAVPIRMTGTVDDADPALSPVVFWGTVRGGEQQCVFASVSVYMHEVEFTMTSPDGGAALSYQSVPAETYTARDWKVTSPAAEARRLRNSELRSAAVKTKRR